MAIFRPASCGPLFFAKLALRTVYLHLVMASLGARQKGAHWAMDSTDAVQDWLRVRRKLLEEEAQFTDLAIQAASGQVALEELAQRRALLELTREVCTAAYRRAFPNAAAPTPSGRT